MSGHEKESKNTDDPTKSLKLDALKAIRESAFQRWEKRRNYEWQLSISIWTALAAFSGIVIGKDFQIGDRWLTAAFVGLIGGGMSYLHRKYVLKMFEHTIADVHIQRWAETEMFKLAFDAKMPDWDARYPSDTFHPSLSKYGRIQAVITLMLACAAVGAVLAPRNIPQQPAPQAEAVPVKK